MMRTDDEKELIKQLRNKKVSFRFRKETMAMMMMMMTNLTRNFVLEYM
jgi:hypothetical protein